MSNVSSKEIFSEDPEMNEFCKDLLDGVAEMKANSFARKTQVPVSNIVVIRNKTGLTQQRFAKLLGVSVRTLQAWESGARKPSGAARTVLRIAEKEPDVLAKLSLS